jgi:DNA-binding transcriptional LysR family regulator
MQMNLSLKQLKVFLGVANASSFTKTAQSMHLSQAALSAIIRELETQLQCRLLERTTRTSPRWR